MTPQQYSAEKTARSGSSFYYSFLFLAPPQREAIIALYAFCREVDDVVDECIEPAVASAKLDWWRSEVTRMFSDLPQHPVSKALQPAIVKFGLPIEAFAEILDGMEMDLEQSRYPDFAALDRYCYRVAGVVGELSATIFGYENSQTLAFAKQLGLAFQLTNIIRDVGEDARRGRIYLPQNELREFGVTEASILACKETPEFEALMRFQIERVRSIYQAALDLLPGVDRKRQKSALIMAAIYQTLLREIERDGCAVLSRKTSLTPLRKFWIAWRTWATT